MSKTETLVQALDALIRARLSGELEPIDHLLALEEAFNDAVEERVEQREREWRAIMAD